MRDYVVDSSRFPDLFQELTQIFKADKHIEVIMTENKKDEGSLIQKRPEIGNSAVFQKKS